LAAFLFRRELVLLTARGFAADPALLALTVLLTAVLLPHVVLVSASAMLQGALNTEKRFFLPQAAAASFSAAVLAYLGLAASPLGAGFTMEQKMIGLAAAASASGLLQCAILLPAAARAGYLPRLSNPLADPAALRLLAMALPALLAAAQDQLSLLVNAFFASFMEAGSITAIHNASRLAQFPVSLFASASAAVALPSLSGGLLQRDPEGFRTTLDSALRLTAVIILPATAGLITLALPVTRALFEHGRFTPEMSALTAAVLACLSAGLAGYAFNKLAASVFYALGDLVTPLWVVALQVALNAALCLVLAPSMGAPGLTLATAISSLAAGAGFALLLARRVPGAFRPGLGAFLARILTASAAMGLACAAGARLTADLPPLASVALLVPAGVWLYFLILRAMGAGGARELLGLRGRGTR
ncbi:MAG: lipid II flippase MurJ, partial [Elusimicrobiales bacterium]|nr:lipid II flippase MurJ [Elusimicrobiales bacterium]